MAVVTITAVPCQMLRVIPVYDNHDVITYAGYCRCGARVLAPTHEDATRALNLHRFRASGVAPYAVCIKLEPARSTWLS